MDYEDMLSHRSNEIVEKRHDREIPTSILLRCMGYVEVEDTHLLLEEIYRRCSEDTECTRELVDYISHVEVDM